MLDELLSIAGIREPTITYAGMFQLDNLSELPDEDELRWEINKVDTDYRSSIENWKERMTKRCTELYMFSEILLRLCGGELERYVEVGPGIAQLKTYADESIFSLDAHIEACRERIRQLPIERARSIRALTKGMVREDHKREWMGNVLSDKSLWVSDRYIAFNCKYLKPDTLVRLAKPSKRKWESIVRLKTAEQIVDMMISQADVEVRFAGWFEYQSSMKESSDRLALFLPERAEEQNPIISIPLFLFVLQCVGRYDKVRVYIKTDDEHVGSQPGQRSGGRFPRHVVLYRSNIPIAILPCRRDNNTSLPVDRSLIKNPFERN
jgi:hypothetical protein